MRQIDKASITVVIPCYRCIQTIGRAIDSVIYQTQRPSEVILVDDASDDGTLDILRKIERKYGGWIKIISLTENVGAGCARNVGWAAATQPYIAFLDADDCWHPEKIEIQYSYMVNNQDVVLCGHGRRIIHQEYILPNWLLGKWRASQLGKGLMLFSNKIVTPSIMVRRDTPHRFLVGRRYMEDQLFLLEIVCDDCRIDRLNVDLVATYKRPYGVDGLSANLWKMERCELDNYRLLHMHGKLSLFSCYGLMIFSILKFLRRLNMTMLWRIQNLS